MSLYTYQPLTSTVEAKIRTIFPQSNENTFKVTVSKNKLEKIDLARSAISNTMLPLMTRYLASLSVKYPPIW